MPLDGQPISHDAHAAMQQAMHELSMRQQHEAMQQQAQWSTDPAHFGQILQHHSPRRSVLPVAAAAIGVIIVVGIVLLVAGHGSATSKAPVATTGAAATAPSTAVRTTKPAIVTAVSNTSISIHTLAGDASFTIRPQDQHAMDVDHLHEHLRTGEGLSLNFQTGAKGTMYAVGFQDAELPASLVKP